MTFDEYDKRISEYADRLRNAYGNEWDELYQEVSEFQRDYMINILEEYKKTIDCEAKEKIYDLLFYVVRVSENGNSIVYVKTEELANEIKNIIQKEIGDYLLDYQIYEENNHWAIDCMFAGFYVPYWNGWKEE